VCSSPLKGNRRFGGTCRLHLQGQRISQTRNQHEAGSKQRLRWRHVPSKRRLTFNALHDVIFQMIEPFTNAHICRKHSPKTRLERNLQQIHEKLTRKIPTRIRTEYLLHTSQRLPLLARARSATSSSLLSILGSIIIIDSQPQHVQRTHIRVSPQPTITFRTYTERNKIIKLTDFS
jgi:hypothetical protein